MARLWEIFTGGAKELLRLEPEELAGVLIEIIPDISQNDMFGLQQITAQVFERPGASWDNSQRRPVELAIAEAIAWLKSQGLVIADPGQNGGYWHVLTRRGKTIKSRADLEAYRKGGILPVGLLQPRLADKVHPLFVRGDHDTAVFQAFKEVEVAVRRACGYGDDMLGRSLMQKAFAVNDGPLSNPELVAAEREAEFFLFSGAIGHAKNPTSHRDVSLSREEAARLIVFASHLLSIVEARAPKPDELN